METQATAGKTAKPSLFALAEQYEQIMHAVEELDGELTPELEAQLEITQEELERKAMGYTAMIRKLETDMAYAQAEAERVAAYIKRKSKQIELLKGNLLNALIIFGKEDKGIYRLDVAGESGVLSLSTRKSESVQIVDKQALPNKYWRIPPAPAPQPDKTAIKQAIKQGEVVPGAVIRNNYSLVIK